MHHHRVRRGAARLTLVASLALSAAACGGSDEAAEHNGADVTFATEMIGHHAQALEMVEMTADRPLSPAVRDLAERISAAQAPEIDQMSSWLVDWGEDVPPTDGAHGGDDMDGEGDSSMPGMMSSEQMSALEDAGDAEFETQWLELMVEHHTGAVEMAETELADGRHAPAQELASEIVDSQRAEIDEMQELLGS